jgi:hypothetical protein
MVTFTPDPGVCTPLQGFFTYTKSDGSATSAPAAITISINCTPTADDKTVSTSQDTPVLITLTGSDTETCELTFAILSGPANGSLSAITNQACVASAPNTDSATVTYTPNPSFSGSDSFTYRITDADADFADATVSITVNPGGPVTVAFDIFTVAANTALENHTPDTGTGWTSAGIQILAADDFTSNVGGGPHEAREDTAIGGDEMDVSVDVRLTTNATNIYGGPKGRMPVTSANNGYIARYSGDGAGGFRVQLITEVNGTETVLNTASVAGDLTNFHTIKLEIRAASKKVFFDGVEVINNTTDDSFIGNQFAGIDTRKDSNLDNYLSESP